MSAHSIVSFLIKREFRGGNPRVALLQGVELVYRAKGPHVVDQVVKELIRYAKEVEQITEMELLGAIHELCYSNGEPLSYPLDCPDFILAPGGKPIWERPKP